MPITHVASTGGVSVTTAVNVTVPVGTASGDLMLLAVTQQNTGVVTVPAGWTLVAKASDAAQDTAVYSKTATGSEPAVALTRDISGKWCAAVSTYRGVSTSAPVSGFATLDSPGSLSAWPLPSVTYSGAAGVRYDAVGQRSSTPATAWTPPAGMTLRNGQYTTGSGASYLGVGDRAATASPDEGGTWTNDGAASSAAAFVSVILGPATATPPPSGGAFSLWNGTKEVPLTTTRWSGTAEQPITATKH